MKRSALKKLFWSSLLLFQLLAPQVEAAKVMQQNYWFIISSINASTTAYMRLMGNCTNDTNATEANMTGIYRTAGTLSNLYINVFSNDRNTSTFRTRKGTSNANLVVSITTSTTGKFEDTTHTDAVAAGDDWHASIVTGSGGTTFRYFGYEVIFEATTNTTMRMGGGGGWGLGTASATNYIPIAGDNSYVASLTEAWTGLTTRTPATLSNLFLYVSANARTTTTTLRSRVNSAFGNLTLSISSGATGTFEDTTHTDTLVSGDIVNLAFTTSTGTETLTYQTTAVDFTTLNGQTMYFCATSESGALVILKNVTTRFNLSGGLNNYDTEANTVMETNLASTSTQLQCYISANTVSSASTLTTRKDSGAGSESISITASTTGIFRDTTNTDTWTAANTINTQIVTPNAGTSLQIQSITLLGSPLTRSRFITVD